MNGLEEFWSDLLSEEPKRVLMAWRSLELDEQESIRAHLILMVTEQGWAEAQREAAQIALTAILDAAGPNPDTTDG